MAHFPFDYISSKYRMTLNSHTVERYAKTYSGIVKNRRPSHSHPVLLKFAKFRKISGTAEIKSNGYGLYSINIAFMDAVGETFGPTIKNVFRKIKLGLDPHGIMSPGKSGIMI